MPDKSHRANIDGLIDIQARFLLKSQALPKHETEAGAQGLTAEICKNLQFCAVAAQSTDAYVRQGLTQPGSQ